MKLWWCLLFLGVACAAAEPSAEIQWSVTQDCDGGMAAFRGAAGTHSLYVACTKTYETSQNTSEQFVLFQKWDSGHLEAPVWEWSTKNAGVGAWSYVAHKRELGDGTILVSGFGFGAIDFLGFVARLDENTGKVLWTSRSPGSIWKPEVQVLSEALGKNGYIVVLDTDVMSGSAWIRWVDRTDGDNVGVALVSTFFVGNRVLSHDGNYVYLSVHGKGNNAFCAFDVSRPIDSPDQQVAPEWCQFVSKSLESNAMVEVNPNTPLATLSGDVVVSAEDIRTGRGQTTLFSRNGTAIWSADVKSYVLIDHGALLLSYSRSIRDPEEESPYVCAWIDAATGAVVDSIVQQPPYDSDLSDFELASEGEVYMLQNSLVGEFDRRVLRVDGFDSTSTSAPDVHITWKVELPESGSNSGPFVIDGSENPSLMGTMGNTIYLISQK